jgi:hypothetical protein
MRLTRLTFALLMTVGLCSGCSLQGWMSSCADCGQVRSITPRQLRNEIRLITDAPQAQYISLEGEAPVPLVYDVRIRMDRGGARDFVVSAVGNLAVGDRVQVHGSQIIPQNEMSAELLWL